jgi:hypothetical protein
MSAEIPEYMSEILRPTPSGVEKLLAAWNDLGFDVQIKILLSLADLKYPNFLHEKIRLNAFNSKNAYIRYLAMKGFYFNEKNSEHQELKKRVENDPSPLVKYSTYESEMGFIFSSEAENSEAFFSLPHEARLAKVRTLFGCGENIAKLFANVGTYISENKISELEVYEILADYVDSPGFKKKYRGDKSLGYDGYAEYSKGKDVEELWKLTLKLPSMASYPLLDTLPEAAGLGSDIPKEVLEGLNSDQLTRLLEREDIYLLALRKKIFFSPERPDLTEHQAYMLRYAATSHNFNFSYQEFATLLPNMNAIEHSEASWKFKDPADENKLKTLTDLGTLAGDLSWVYLQAIHDFLFAVPVRGFHAAFEDAEWPKKRLDKALEESKKDKKNSHIRSKVLELELYSLAVSAVPWDKTKKGYEPSGELDFLAQEVVEGDTWATFMAFINKWKEQKNTLTLEKALPEIYEFDDEDKGPSQSEEQSAVPIAPQSKSYEKEIIIIQQLLKRVKFIGYVVIALLLWLLLK